MERSPSISGDSENDFFGKNPVLSMPPTAIFNSCVWLIPNTCHWCLLFRMCHCPNNSFFKWANSGLFLLIFVLFKHKFYRKNCRLQRDSNSDRQRRWRARWPLNHHHGHCPNNCFDQLLSCHVRLRRGVPEGLNVDSQVQRVPHAVSWKWRLGELKAADNFLRNLSTMKYFRFSLSIDIVIVF